MLRQCIRGKTCPVFPASCSSSGRQCCLRNTGTARRVVAQRAYANVSQSLIDTSNSTDSFIQGISRGYVDEMYLAWKANPQQVHESWQDYFSNMKRSPTLAVRGSQPHQASIASPNETLNPTHNTQYAVNIATVTKVQRLINEYRARGHLRAAISPLTKHSISGSEQRLTSSSASELELEHYGLSKSDLSFQVPVSALDLPQKLFNGQTSMSLREIIDTCKSIYCASIGLEYEHIPDRRKREWLRDRIETMTPHRFSKEEKWRILQGLVRANTFERFLGTKFPTTKRYGLDGAESLVPAVRSILDHCGDVHGIEDVVIGSCHRGRSTMLTSVYGKPYETILAEFSGAIAAKPVKGMEGDAKYHLGHDGDYVTPEGRQMSLSLLPNPSHLEAVDAVATGKTYAKQAIMSDPQGNRSMCLALHGDAAFAGQGIAYEVMNLSQIPGYGVGGTIRLMVNNQIGHTTDPANSRSTVYCSDLAKFVDAPILHVNAEDVEALISACHLAADWRATFHSDIVVDVVCYRKFGHNEMDQPNLTQPLMYQEIAEKKTSLDVYIEKLIDEGSFSAAQIQQEKDRVWTDLEGFFQSSKSFESKPQYHPPTWKGLLTAEDLACNVVPHSSTSVSKDSLGRIAAALTTIPSNFQPHRNVQRVFGGRQKAFEGGTVDWSMGEALAFGSLCAEGYSIRLTGQDVQRGTFSQRHAVIHSQTTGKTWTPLSHVKDGQGKFAAINSPLSEFGTLGFEYGYTLADPNALVMWEAQFGDFANNCQVIIDNFLSGGESKWMDRSGLVLSLPHGYDGQGSEHSSARLERFLMLCNEEGRKMPENPARQDQDSNMRVVYPTTAANYFHLLRRQLHRPYRKPLVVFFSKSLLRNDITRSDVSELTGASTFKPVLRDPKFSAANSDTSSVSRMLLCTGQVYAALAKHRDQLNISDTAITRIEELHPFPFDKVIQELDAYPSLKSVTWVQEEPYNGGAWHQVRDRLDTVLANTQLHRSQRIECVSRPPSATPATGMKDKHEAENQQLLKDAFSRVD